MPTTTPNPTAESTHSMQDAVRAWDLDANSALAVVAFPFTSRRLPREARSHKS